MPNLGSRLGQRNAWALPERLHSRAEYLQIQNKGRKFRSRNLTLMVGRIEPQDPRRTSSQARMGYTVSRKVGIAVVRNRVRRKLKEVVRQFEGGLPLGFDHVIVAHPPAAGLNSDVLRQELTCLLTRAVQWVQQIPSCTALLPSTG